MNQEVNDQEARDYRLGDSLRKDQVFLFERFHYSLEEKNERGVIVMDETDKNPDWRFVTLMENYFTKTVRRH